MSILVMSDICDYRNRVSYHYSLVKGFEVTKGFSKLTDSFYLTTGVSEKFEGVNLINIKKINDNFLNKIKYILIGREPVLKIAIEKIPSFKKLIFKKNRHQLIGVKSDSCKWINSYDKEFIKKHIDLIYVQTQGFKNLESKTIMKNDKELIKKLHISRMGIPNKMPLSMNNENPYKIDHSYCVDNFRSMADGKALLPLTLMSHNKNFIKNNIIENFNKKKTIIIYIGRIRTDGGKVLFLMKEIMQRLGDEYELHIFPGRFTLPNCKVSVFSPKWGINLQLLRDSMFYDCNNIIIHYPYDHKDSAKYLQYADIGLDFSPIRPKNEKTVVGNTKLMEYCYFGLKVIGESNVINSDLVINGKNGILLDGIATADEYVEGIRLLNKMPYKKEYTIKKTIDTNNWDLIASEILNDFKKVELRDNIDLISNR